MFEDREGRLWLFLQFGGYSYKLENDRIEKIDTGIIRRCTRLRHFTGRQWRYLVRHRTTRRVPLSQEHFFCFDTNNGLSSNYVRSMLLDREGTFG